MKEPYQFIFSAHPDYVRNVAGYLPLNAKYPLANANSATLTGFGDDTLLRQSLNSRPFLVDVLQMDSRDPFSFHFRIDEPQLFLFFLIRGSVRFHADKIPIIAHTHNRLFNVAYYYPGTYRVDGVQGENIALIVTMKPIWVRRIRPICPNINALLEMMETKTKLYENLPICNVDDQVNKWLREVYTYSNDNPGALDGTLRKYIALTLKHYDSLVVEKLATPAYRAKARIDADYAEPLNNEGLADECATTVKTLIANFKNIFGSTPHAYLTHVRMYHAKQLMMEKHLKPKDVYWQVGYQDIKSFRVQYLKTYGSMP